MRGLLVIARYNENVDWLKYSPIPHVVYNKGEEDLPDWVVSKPIPNIGFEEYAYLSYIVENYDNLPDRVIFSQAQPFVHSPDFLQLLNHTELYGEVQPLSYQYLEHDPPHYFKQYSSALAIKNLRIHIEFFDKTLLRFDKNSGDFRSIRPGGSEIVYNLLSEDFGIDVRLGMLKLLEIPDRTLNDLKMTPMCYGGIFSVVKKRICDIQKVYYENLIRIAKKNDDQSIDHYTRKKFAWIMEMMWLELFGYEPPKELYTPNPIGKWWNNV